MRVFDVWASSLSPSYLCAKCSFCRGLHCWASPWRKIAYQSITHPAYLMRREPKLSLRNSAEWYNVYDLLLVDCHNYVNSNIAVKIVHSYMTFDHTVLSRRLYTALEAKLRFNLQYDSGWAANRNRNEIRLNCRYYWHYSKTLSCLKVSYARNNRCIHK